MRIHLATKVALALPLLAVAADAQTPLPTTRLVNGLSQPVWAGAPPGDDRIFIVQKGGRIRILQGGSLLGTDFMNIASKVQTGSEKGLLGMEFAPDYATSGEFYVHYTRAGGGSGGTSVVARYRVTANPDVADVTSEQILLTLSQPFTNHNGGHVAFGGDGMLYIGFGDGGSANDPNCNAQKTNTWLGKMLRIDVSGGGAYSVPADNPFVSTPGVLPEIVHTGLRNPWRYSFDPLTDDLFIGDVGQDAREEIDVVAGSAKGLNFGWKQEEGTRCNSTGNCPGGIPNCGDASLVNPVVELSHGGFSGPCTIVGGVVYRGCAIPDLDGTYFYTDYCDDKLRTFVYDPVLGALNQLDRTAELKPTVGTITSVVSYGYDGFGEILIVDYNGELYKVLPAATPVGLIDCDGNGRDDPCEIGMFPDLDLSGDGVLDSCQSLSADLGDISVADGGTQSLQLHAGGARGGDFYFLAGSVTGTAPGTPLGPITVPLNYDAYTALTVLNPNTPPLSNSFANLDGLGDAAAAFSVGAGQLPVSMVGTSAHHAYVLVNGLGQADFASNPIELRFQT